MMPSNFRAAQWMVRVRVRCDAFDFGYRDQRQESLRGDYGLAA